MTEKIRISPQAVSGALDKAEHYRLLNEPEEAESICLDALEVAPENQRALVLLLLARTDQFPGGSPKLLAQAREVLEKIEGEYARAYYGGLICERKAKAILGKRGKRSGFVAYEWFRYALEEYKKAMDHHPEDNEDAILRWNTCLRIIERHPHCRPDPEDHPHLGLE